MKCKSRRTTLGLKELISLTINYATMSWMEQDENKLLQRSFFFGMIGILFCMVPLFNRNFHFWDWGNINLLTGIGIGVQLFALSIAVLVIRKRKISYDTKNKAQRMSIALTVALIFFFMI